MFDRSARRHISLSLLPTLFLAAPLLANPFTQAVDQRKADDEELRRAQEQIENPRAKAREDALFVPPFHQRDPQPDSPPTLCHRCHGNAPHYKNARKRAFLNNHSRKIACETCHWRPETVQPEYRRLSFLQVPDEQGLIVPWVNAAPVLTWENDPWAQRLMRRWENAGNEQKAELKAQLHQPLEQQGSNCVACHDEQENMLDWQALGYAPGKIREMEGNPIARFLHRTEPESEDDPVVRIHLRDLLE